MQSRTGPSSPKAEQEVERLRRYLERIEEMAAGAENFRHDAAIAHLAVIARLVKESKT